MLQNYKIKFTDFIKYLLYLLNVFMNSLLYYIYIKRKQNSGREPGPYKAHKPTSTEWPLW